MSIKIEDKKYFIFFFYYHVLSKLFSEIINDWAEVSSILDVWFLLMVFCQKKKKKRSTCSYLSQFVSNNLLTFPRSHIVNTRKKFRCNLKEKQINKKYKWILSTEKKKNWKNFGMFFFLNFILLDQVN